MICDKIEQCSEVFDKPIENCNDPKGGKSTFRIENSERKKYIKINFEDCVYKGRENETKCDYAFICGKTIFFVELKGTDVQKGFEQLAATISETKKCFKEYTLNARLVVTRNSAPDIAKKCLGYKKLVKSTKSILVKQNLLIEKI